jgi:hypothetical protein
MNFTHKIYSTGCYSMLDGVECRLVEYLERDLVRVEIRTIEGWRQIDLMRHEVVEGESK